MNTTISFESIVFRQLKELYSCSFSSCPGFCYLLLAVLTEYVKEKGENEFTRAGALAAMRRAGSKYKSGSVSANLSYRCCANIPRYYKPMYNDYEKIGDGLYRIKNFNN